MKQVTNGWILFGIYLCGVAVFLGTVHLVAWIGSIL